MLRKYHFAYQQSRTPFDTEKPHNHPTRRHEQTGSRPLSRNSRSNKNGKLRLRDLNEQ